MAVLEVLVGYKTFVSKFVHESHAVAVFNSFSTVLFESVPSSYTLSTKIEARFGILIDGVGNVSLAGGV